MTDELAARITTGSLYADYLLVLVTLGESGARTALIESGRPGVGLPDDWDGFGTQPPLGVYF